MNEKIKACWFCPHFYYSEETPGYSELTPGDDFGIECNKSHWKFSKRRTSQEEFGEILMTANTCPDYSEKPNLA